MSRYQELAEHTARLIADGLLRPGERLPSVRQACRIHAISPVTVTQAYPTGLPHWEELPAGEEYTVVVEAPAGPTARLLRIDPS